MGREYRTVSDENGVFSYPESLGKAEIIRAVALSAPDESEEIPRFGGFRTRTLFTRTRSSWNLEFALIPTTEHSSLKRDDDVLEFYRAQGVLRHSAFMAAVDDLVHITQFAILDLDLVGERERERLANTYSFEAQRNAYDFEVRARWSFPVSATQSDDDFVSRLASIVEYSAAPFPRPVDIRIAYLPGRSQD